MGLRQDELAAAAGVGLRFLVELERGKPTVELGRALAVLAAVGLDLQVVARLSPAAPAAPA
jgi:transcriptional regulator with XRE-family HTH domain